jgi:hypothetical protein
MLRISNASPSSRKAIDQFHSELELKTTKKGDMIFTLSKENEDWDRHWSEVFEKIQILRPLIKTFNLKTEAVLLEFAIWMGGGNDSAINIQLMNFNNAQLKNLADLGIDFEITVYNTTS